MWLLKQKSDLFSLLAILIAVPLIVPLLHPGVFVTDDLEWMIIRFSAFHQAVVDGQIPVRWLGRLNHEYGYPVVNFNYPAFLYIAEIPKFFGFGFISSIKFILGASVVFGSLFTYLWLKRRFDVWGSFVGTCFYLYAPYYLFDLYKRGSLGEVMALAVAPFILYQIERRSLLWSSIGIAGLVLSHNILAALFLPVIAIYGFLRKVSSIKYLVTSILLGLGMSAFFWIPAIFDLQYTKFFETRVSLWEDHFANFSLLGLASFLILPSAFAALRKRGREPVVWFFLLVASVAVVLSFPVATPVWQILPVSFIQFPFRLLSLVVVAGAFLTAFFLGAVEEKRTIAAGIFLIIIILFSARTFILPSGYVDKGEGFYATNEHSTAIHDEYMPKWVEVVPNERPSRKVEIEASIGKAENIVARKNAVTFTAAMNQEGSAEINIIYFPGWKAFVDGKKTMIDFKNERGIMKISIPAGEHVVSLRFGETPLRLASDSISIGSLFLLLFAVRRRRK